MKRVLVAILGITAVAICRPALAFRTAEDSLEFAGAGKVAWSTNEVPFVMYEDMPSGVSAGALQSAIELALVAWSNAGCAVPPMQLDGYTAAPALSGDGSNTIQWVMTNWSDYGFPKSAAAMTDVQYQENVDGGWDIVEADIYVNADNFDWSGTADKSKDIGAVTLHEAGHVLGLLHICEADGGDGAPYCATKSSFAEAVMYPVYQSSSRQLGTDDIAGVCYLYPGESGCSKAGCDVGEICTSIGCQKSCGGQVCLAGYYCKDNECVRPDGTSSGGAGNTEACGAAGAAGSSCTTTAVLTSGDGQLWDPCQKNEDCSSGLGCIRGYCTVGCSVDTECGTNGKCSKKSICEPNGATFGEDCDKAEDCVSSVCISQDNNVNRCTRECDAESNSCPNGWSCTDPDGEGFVCMPERAEGCSCRVAGARGTGGSWSVLVLGLLLVRRFSRRYLKWSGSCW